LNPKLYRVSRIIWRLSLTIFLCKNHIIFSLKKLNIFQSSELYNIFFELLLFLDDPGEKFVSIYEVTSILNKLLKTGRSTIVKPVINNRRSFIRKLKTHGLYQDSTWRSNRANRQWLETIKRSRLRTSVIGDDQKKSIEKLSPISTHSLLGLFSRLLYVPSSSAAFDAIKTHFVYDLSTFY